MIKLAQRYKHQVICVSARTNCQKNHDLLSAELGSDILIYLTSHNPKKEYMEQRGIKVDWWIEDNPIAIFKTTNPERRLLDDMPIM